MLTPEETLSVLNVGQICADFEKSQPTKVWVIEHEAYAYRALETRPFKGYRNLVWALVEAMSISRTRNGINVVFWKDGTVGWFSYGNVCLTDVVQATT